jgi:hypothetical protein
MNMIEELSPDSLAEQLEPSKKTKRCKKCGFPKPLKEFHRQPMCRDGHKNSCIDCDKKYNAARYLKKKVEIIAAAKAWQALNPEKSSSYKTKWRLKNIPPIRTKFQNGHEILAQIRENTKNTQNTQPEMAHSMEPIYK